MESKSAAQVRKEFWIGLKDYCHSKDIDFGRETSAFYLQFRIKEINKHRLINRGSAWISTEKNYLKIGFMCTNKSKEDFNRIEKIYLDFQKLGNNIDSTIKLNNKTPMMFFVSDFNFKKDMIDNKRLAEAYQWIIDKKIEIEDFLRALKLDS